MQFVKTNISVRRTKSETLKNEIMQRRSWFYSFFLRSLYRWKTDKKYERIFLVTVKFILFRNTLILRLVDSFSEADSEASREEEASEKEEGKTSKRSDNKGRWDRIHFAISCFIHSHSLEKKTDEEGSERFGKTPTGEFIRSEVFHHSDFLAAIHSNSESRGSSAPEICIRNIRNLFLFFFHNVNFLPFRVFRAFFLAPRGKQRNINFPPKLDSRSFERPATTRTALIGKFLHVKDNCALLVEWGKSRHELWNINSIASWQWSRGNEHIFTSFSH